MKKPINHSGAAPSAHDDHLADALDYFRQGLSAEVWLNESVNIPFEEIAKASERVRRKFRKRGHFVFIGIDLAKPIRKENMKVRKKNMKAAEQFMTQCSKSIYVAATTLDRRIGQKCAWCSVLSPEEEALVHAISAVKDSYRHFYPRQCEHLDEFEKNYKGADASIAAFNGEADMQELES